ncbi:MAG: hypothetical protein HC806_01090 [Anaerolineae bacterium]|nr:hypothetical protein [Anaerolineae bacterium]
MGNRWLIYTLIGLAFGIVDWYFLEGFAWLSKTLDADRIPLFFQLLFITVFIGTNYGVWLIPVIPVAIYETRQTQIIKMRLSRQSLFGPPLSSAITLTTPSSSHLSVCPIWTSCWLPIYNHPHTGKTGILFSSG